MARHGLAARSQTVSAISALRDMRCLLCDGKIRLFKMAVLSDQSVVCGDCLEQLGLKKFENSQRYDARSFVELVNVRGERGTTFHADKTVLDGKISVDERRETLRVNGAIYLYENILSYELLEEDGTVVTTGGLGSAAVGGLLFGPVGAVVGGSTGKRTSCTSRSFKIRISFIDGPSDLTIVRCSSAGSVSNRGLQDALAVLERACHRRDEIAQAAASGPAAPAAAPDPGHSFPAGDDAADLIRKFKALADDGVITQEEFEAKKRQLLRL